MADDRKPDNMATDVVRGALPPLRDAGQAPSRMPQAAAEAAQTPRPEASAMVDARRRIQREAERPNPAAMKVWRVYPVDAQEPPFHFSNTAGAPLVYAESADYARRMMVTDQGDEVWGDEDRVCVEEFKPAAPMILTRDYKG